MEAKFTKGPWKIYGDWGIQPESAKGDKNIFATFESSINDKGENNGFDNAALIVAAPEMYELLQEFLPMDEDGNGEFQYNEGSEYLGEKVLALLAKARGE